MIFDRVMKNIFLIIATYIAMGMSLAVCHAEGMTPPEHESIIWGFDKFGDFQDPMGIFYDERNDEIYLADTGNKRICVFAGNGMPLVEYNTFREIDNISEFQAPLDVAVDSSGTIFVSDNVLNRVIGMDFRGNLLVEIDLSKAEEGRISPGRIAIDEDDNLFIMDGSNNQVLVYTTSGRYRYKFGKMMGGATGITKVSDVYPDRKHSVIYVSSFQGPSILVFDYDGFQVRSFGKHDSGDPNFSLPTGVVATSNGIIYATDMLRSDTKVYTSEGKYVGKFGGVGRSVNATIFPADLDISEDGRLFFVEKKSARIHIFKIVWDGVVDEE